MKSPKHESRRTHHGYASSGDLRPTSLDTNGASAYGVGADVVQTVFEIHANSAGSFARRATPLNTHDGAGGRNEISIGFRFRACHQGV